MNRRTTNALRWLTPSGVSLALFLLSLIYSDMREMRKDVTTLKERIARVETRQPFPPAGLYPHADR